MPIKVLVVDDSALIRAVLKEIIQQDPELLLIGQAPDAYVARDLVKQFNPDVITLDIEMPRMDGLSFLEKLMDARPTPVIMISSGKLKNYQGIRRQNIIVESMGRKEEDK